MTAVVTDSVIDDAALRRLRDEVRAFLRTELDTGAFSPRRTTG